MSIPFERTRTSIRIINPMKDFTLDEIPLEIRVDPLTGQTGRVFDLPYTPPEPPDLAELVRRSKEIFCPFCPETLEKSTPLFPEEVIPEGRITVGRASLIPNLLPLDTYAGVVILSPDHYTALEDFTADGLADAFSAAQRFTRRIAEHDPRINCFYLNWNYMPPAGSSLIHPHMQVNCGLVPTNQHRLQIEGGGRYHEQQGGNFWEAYIEAEKECGERVIGERGPTFWTMSFVPHSFLPDVWCIFPRHASLYQLEKEESMPFLEGVSRVLRHFSRQGVYSFNMGLFSVREDDHFRMNARFCPRLLTRPIGNSDRTYLQAIHREPYSVRPPEADCPKVRACFEQ